MKVMIVSQPKAGTYLCSQLLVEFGLVQTYRHYNKVYYVQYDTRQLDLGKQDPKQFRVREPVELGVLSIKHGEFAASHLEPEPSTVAALREFKKILLTRPEEEIVDSYLRWQEESQRHRPVSDRLHQQIANIPLWADFDDVFAMSFADLVEPNLEKIDLLQQFLFDKVKFSSYNAIKAALAANTLTKSQIRS